MGLNGCLPFGEAGSGFLFEIEVEEQKIRYELRKGEKQGSTNQDSCRRQTARRHKEKGESEIRVNARSVW